MKGKSGGFEEGKIDRKETDGKLRTSYIFHLVILPLVICFCSMDATESLGEPK